MFDAHANGNTPCTITAAACKSIVFTGAGGDWANTFKINDTFTLTVSGLVTLKNTFTWTQSTGTLLMGTVATLTNNSKEINCDFSIGNVTITVADTMHVNGDLKTSAAGDANALSAGGATALTCSKGVNAARKITLTNVTITLDGTGTWTGSATNGRYLDGNVTINTAGIITMTTPSWGGGTLTYTGGTISSGTTTFYLQETGTMSGAFPSTAFYNLATTAASTLTIDNALYVTNNLALGASLTMSGNYAFDPANISTSATSTLTIVRPITVPGTVSLSANLTMAGNYDTIFTNITGIAASTLTAVNSIQGINTIRVNEGIALTFAGSFPQICKNLQVDSAGSLIFPSDYELTVTDSLISNGTSFDTATIRGGYG